MNVEAVLVGTELLSGELSDRHAARLGRLLRAWGMRLSRATLVPDDPDLLASSLRAAWERSDLVIVSGGLGPTTDDLTLASAAQAAGVPREACETATERVVAWYRARGIEPTDAQLDMARVPRGARALDNPVGSAPGVWMEHGGCHTLFLPGVPRELESMLELHLVPFLKDRSAAGVWSKRVFRTFNVPESRVGDALQDLELPAGVEIAYRASFPEVRVTAHIPPDLGEDDPGVQRLVEAIRLRLGSWIYSESENEAMPEVVGRLLASTGQTLALAESCTGGLLASRLTDIPGASGWFLEGLVTYTNASKMRLLGVREDSLIAHGAVSAVVAGEMAEGVRQRSGADIGVAITGIAGPSGGTPDKPVGTVHLAIATDTGVENLARSYTYDRARNRDKSAWDGLNLVRQYLLKTDT